MQRLLRSSVFSWTLALLALAPLLLWAYLGQFSRVIGDDFNILDIGRQLGPWDTMIFFRHVFNGSYSNYFLQGLVAPLDTLGPQIMPAIILALWTAGLVWLALNLLGALGIQRNRLPIAITLAALTATATTNAFPTTESLLWYAASTRYALPLAGFGIYLAAGFAFAKHERGRAATMLAVAASGVGGFLIAGLSEMYLVFQFTFLTLLLAFVLFALEGRATRRAAIRFLGAGWVATVMSFALQWSAPGVAQRMQLSIEAWANPVRNLPDLVSGTVDWTFKIAGHQATFGGFMLLLAIGLFYTLTWHKPTGAEISGKRQPPARAPLVMGLVIQLGFIPVLWSHISDNPQVFNRYSIAFASVLAINAALIAALLLLLWRRDSGGVLGSGAARGWQVYSSAWLLVVLGIFGLTQLRSIDERAATYMFLTALSLLGVVCWQLLIAQPGRSVSRLGLGALCWLLTTAAVTTATVSVALYGQGTVVPRILTASVCVQVIGGLVWGVWIGVLVKRVATLRGMPSWWTAGIQALCFGLVALLIMGMALALAGPIADMQEFAQEWDARHQLMLELRESGAADLEVPLLEFDVTRYLCCSNETSRDKANFFYGFKARTLELPNG